jgi:hypothetical protein
MIHSSPKSNYRWLVACLCVLLSCAWVTQQPIPAKKAATKVRTATTDKRPSAKATKPSAMATMPEATTTLNAQGAPVDVESRLAVDDNMVLVKGQCTGCHSTKLILQSHFDRDKWVERIRWMQRTQKLWDLGETEKPILDYLVKHYGPLPVNFDGRRLPLDPPRWHTR